MINCSKKFTNENKNILLNGIDKYRHVFDDNDILYQFWIPAHNNNRWLYI